MAFGGIFLVVFLFITICFELIMFESNIYKDEDNPLVK